VNEFSMTSGFSRVQRVAILEALYYGFTLPLGEENLFSRRQLSNICNI